MSKDLHEKVGKSYISSKITIGKSKVGKGLFAIEKIAKGEILVNFFDGPGNFINTEEARELYQRGNDYMMQIDDNIHFAAENPDQLEEADFINHSCDPNCGIMGSMQIVSMRDIEAREEITLDYAMSESSPFKMICKCGSKNCRYVITGDDWKIEDLQKRYDGFFSDYLNKKINSLIRKK